MKKDKTFKIILTILVVLIIGLSVFLYFKNTTYHFSLKGEEEIILFNNEKYQEPGFTLVDYLNNDITSEVKVESNIIDNVPGEYEVKYYIKDKEVAKRKVIIKSIDFHLNGEEEIIINVNEDDKYIESGYVAIDNNNQNYAQQVLVEGEVKENEIGEYEIKYTLIIDNYEKTLTRKVKVVNYIKNIKLNLEQLEMKVLDTKKLEVIIEPNDAINTNYTWQVSDENIISINNGEIKALGEGETIVKVITTNNKVATCLVKVSKKDDLISFTEVKSTVTGKEIKADVKTLSKLEPIISYYSDSSCTKKTGVPTSIGTYYIKAETSGNNIYNKTSLNCSKGVVITRIPITIRVGTLNMGGFFCGTGGVKCNNSNVNGFGNLFNQGKVDIIGVQEAAPTSKTTSVATLANLSNTFFRSPASTIGILSKYSFKSKISTPLTNCMEAREIQKVVINVNGIDISFYNSHFSYQTKCLNPHFEHAAKIIKDDPNPTIIVADFNAVSSSYYNNYLKPIGFEVAAYDDNWHNGKTDSYCDAVFINPKGHISFIKKESILAYGVVSDHNFVVATISVY